MNDLRPNDTVTSTADPTREVSVNATENVRRPSSPYQRQASSLAHSAKPVLSNWDVHFYSEVFHAIRAMTEIPEGEPLRLDEETAERAIDVLGFLKEQVKIDPPRLINQDGDALALTWVKNGLKSYLTVADDEIDLMHVSLKDMFRCEEVLSEKNEIPFDKILARLSAQVKSESLDDEY